MLDHVHLLLTRCATRRAGPYSRPSILKLLKGCSARSVNKLSGSGGPVWPEESFDGKASKRTEPSSQRLSAEAGRTIPGSGLSQPHVEQTIVGRTDSVERSETTAVTESFADSSFSGL
jgi:hypothetical protein